MWLLSASFSHAGTSLRSKSLLGASGGRVASWANVLWGIPIWSHKWLAIFLVLNILNWFDLSISRYSKISKGVFSTDTDTWGLEINNSRTGNAKGYQSWGRGMTLEPTMKVQGSQPLSQHEPATVKILPANEEDKPTNPPRIGLYCLDRKIRG